MPGPRLPRKKKGTHLYGSTAAVGAVAYWAWLTKSVSTKPELWVGDGDIKDRVLPHCSTLLQPYTPAPLALNTHVQNILGFIRGATLHASYTRQLVIAHDGGTLGLDWFNGCDAARFAPPNSPVLLVLHGINGGSHEGYCKWVCSEACKRGWRAVVLNYRGCAGLPLTSPRGYAATLTHDVHYAITSIKARFPSSPLFAVGYSLGGVFLTKYLAESDSGLHRSLAASTSSFEPFEGSGLAATAVVSSPVCLTNSSANLGVPWTLNYLYNVAVAYKMREFMHEHQAAIRANTTLNLDAALGQWTVSQIEDKGIPQTQGFNNRQEYYEAVSSLKFIPQITTPTLFLVAKDDPFLGVLPDAECAANPHTLLAATERGGHVAFLRGLWPLGPAFMDAAVLQFLEQAWTRLPPKASPQDTHRAEPLPQQATSLPHTPNYVAWELGQRSAWSGEGSGAADMHRTWLDVGVLPREARKPHVQINWQEQAATRANVMHHKQRTPVDHDYSSASHLDTHQQPMTSNLDSEPHQDSSLQLQGEFQAPPSPLYPTATPPPCHPDDQSGHPNHHGSAHPDIHTAPGTSSPPSNASSTQAQAQGPMSNLNAAYQQEDVGGLSTRDQLQPSGEQLSAATAMGAQQPGAHQSSVDTSAQPADPHGQWGLAPEDMVGQPQPARHEPQGRATGLPAAAAAAAAVLDAGHCSSATRQDVTPGPEVHLGRASTCGIAGGRPATVAGAAFIAPLLQSRL